MSPAASETLCEHVPELRDGDLVVRPLTAGDAAAVAAAVPAGGPGAWEAAPGPYTPGRARGIIARWDHARGRGERLALAVVDGHDFAGSVVLPGGTPEAPVSGRGDALEVACWIRPEARGRGLTARALGLVTTWAGLLPGARRLCMEVDPENAASRRGEGRRRTHTTDGCGGRRRTAGWRPLDLRAHGRAVCPGLMVRRPAGDGRPRRTRAPWPRPRRRSSICRAAARARGRRRATP